MPPRLGAWTIVTAAMQVYNTAEWLQEDSMHAIHCIAIHSMDDGDTIQK